MIKPLILAIGALGLVACSDDIGTSVEGSGNIHNDLMGGSANLSSEMMKKTAFYFSDELPSQDTLANMNESDYRHAVNQIVQGAGFTDRLVAIFEDKLMSDKYISSNDRDGAIDLYNSRDYPNRKWYDDEYEDQGTIRNCVRDLTNDALTNASIELVRHVISTDQAFSNVLTADYMMVNYYSAKSLDAQLINGGDFHQLDTPVCTQTDSGQIVNSISYDPSDFQPARIVHPQQRFDLPVAHAGILSDVVFLNRYPTTDTNRNRHRARIVMDYFLDFDILSIDKDRTIDANDSVNAIPTMDNPDCTICHNMMDPIASTFRSRNSTGRIIPVELNRGDNAWNLNDILTPGYLGRTTPQDVVENYSMLPWLAQQIVTDVRFPRAMIKTLYRGLYGAIPDENLESSEDFSNYEMLIDDAIVAFTSNNMDIREAAKVMVENEMWANAQKTNQANTNLKRRLVTPEILNKKLKMLTGESWDDLNSKSREIMFGGVDSDSVTERLTDPNGIYSKMQNRMAVEMACKAVASDLALPNSVRKLFPYVDVATLPTTQDGEFDNAALASIKQNIQYLHSHLLNENLELSDPELLFTYQLFLDAQKNGLERIENRDDYDPKPLTSLHSACSIQSNHPALADMIGDNAQTKELRSVRYPTSCLSIDESGLSMQSCSGERTQTWITQNGQVKWGNDSSQCITASALSNGGDLVLAPCDSDNVLQNWNIQGAQLRNGNFAIDVSGNNQSKVHVWSNHGGDNQAWSLDGTDIRSDINKDENYVIRAWMAVVTYLLSDALFIYE